ncbi:hypothetical protein ACH0BF_02100 [Pseudobacillus sp. 179-B 2D1 NHS]|uniref:hypothetical protein n=1 Tax=Pseudobacillus sp. 179-B 2D1 NHS TaxID=3374292 RepID=UPI00387A0652
MFYVEFIDYETNHTFAILPDLTLREALECIRIYKREDHSYYDYEKKMMMHQRYVSSNRFVKRKGDKTIKGFQLFLEAYQVKTN